ncbi:protein FAR1-RELATED SEQUENCE 5-like [Asparagus officinalis]|uniref:protein FAR1-RELATED SEQUENCE 5-like n=1 Tax=Asparagus officinalis TaxID=4686 RepID=UPI00098DE5E7|nr:protein FAR1-RELATED SEQUENCE 5-like [Asparagus officinalis]
MSEYGMPHTQRSGLAESQQPPPEPHQTPPESQQAPQYLIDLMAPLVAKIAAIEELVANHITQPPPVVETAISQENGTAKFQKDKMDNLGTEANEVNLDDDDLIYTPQVSDELRPKKGQEFDTIDDVVTFYNAYAKVAGFSHQQFNLLGVQFGGIENIGCTQRDLYNHARDIRADLKGHDGEMFYEYLKLEQGKNPSFTFQIEADEEQKITRCFWSDARSRRAYKFFGDVVIFDTTYNTNRYGLIFAPIIGVNNHGQTIVFACGFLNHESVDDFVWLFNQFMESMPGGAPKMIITDQDPTMTKAFPLVLPNTFHRYCSWHILMKFSEKIDAVKYSIYKSEFSACIWKSETPEEFDLQWESLIKKSGLEGNKWLQDQYELRSRWIPTYVNHIFSADMSSSQ